MEKELIISMIRRKRIVLAIIITIIVASLCIATINGGCFWGDDFAAYLNEGIAIANGQMSYQAKLNYYMHPSQMADSVNNNELIYVWGFPLVLSSVYKIIGTAGIIPSQFVIYKIPSVICLVGIAVVLFYFLSRRLHITSAFILTILFTCMSTEFFNAVNNLNVDIPFLFFALLSFLLVEYFHQSSTFSQKVFSGIFAGIVFWMTFETRTNGITVIIATLIFSFIALKKYNGKKYICFLPYLIMVLLVIISETILGTHSSNISDLGKGIKSIFYNFKMNLNYFLDWWYCLFPFKYGKVLSWMSLIIAMLGVIKHGFKKDNIHITTFSIGTCLGVILLPYTSEGLRYLYPVLPFVFLFFGYGVEDIVLIITKRNNKTLIIKKIICILACAFCLLPISVTVKSAVVNIKNGWVNYKYGPYDKSVVEMYEYIKNNTHNDDVILFSKPRALFLNTNRVSFTLVNNHFVDEADYYLYVNGVSSEIEKEKAHDKFMIVFENDQCTFYKAIE